jgi:D-alanyl-D-alanine carboxypeptidase
MANQTVLVGPDSLPKLLIDLNGDESEFADAITAPPSPSTETLQVDAASVDAAAWSVVAADATGGKRWAKFRVKCNKAHTVEFYGAAADFSAIANGAKLKDYTSSGNSDNSSTLGDVYYVPCGGLAYIAARVQNNDASNAATVTVGVVIFD